MDQSSKKFSELGYRPDEPIPYPNRDISNADKQGIAYCRSTAKAIYYEYINDRTFVTSSDRDQAVQNRLYSKGRQSMQKHKKKYVIGKDEMNKSISFLDLDYQPIAFIPKFVKAVTGFFEKQNFDIRLSAIDKLSDDKRKRHKAQMWVSKQERPAINTARAVVGLPQVQEPEINTQYTTREELDLIHKMKFKLSTEIEMIQYLKANLKLNDWKEISKKIIRDLVVVDTCGVREWMTPDGKIKCRRVMKENLIVRTSHHNDFKDSDLMGEILRVPFRQIIEEGGFKVEELQQIAAEASSNKCLYDVMNGKAIDVDSQSFREGIYHSNLPNNLVDVVDIVWFETETYWSEVKKGFKGKTRRFSKPHGYRLPEYSKEVVSDKTYYYKFDFEKNEKIEISQYMYDKMTKKEESYVEKTCLQVPYQCKWIVGTEFCYEYGRCYDIPRKASNLRETYLPFHLYTLNDDSMVQSLRTHEDAANSSWLKIQALKSQARPPGVAIDIDSLENLQVADENWDPLQVVGFYNQTGNFLFRGSTYDDEFSRTSPVTELRGGLGSAYAELVQDINQQIDYMRLKSGVNEIFDGTNANPRQGLGTSQMLFSGTTNTLTPILSAYINVYERTVEAFALRIQQASKANKLTGYKEAFGEESVEIIKIGNDMSLMEMGIEVKILPDSSMIADLLDAAKTALNTRNENGQGQITYTDYLLVSNYAQDGQLALAEQVLQKRIDKRSEDIEANRQQRAQEAIAQSQAKGEQDRATKQADAAIKLDADKQLYGYKALVDVQKEQNLAMVKKDAEQFKLTGELAKISAQGEETRATKLLEAGLEASKTEEVNY